MKNTWLPIVVALALVLAACTKNEPDQKPVYFVPPTALDA
jgi:outer membrane PBP1 activator LpoA protein